MRRALAIAGILALTSCVSVDIDRGAPFSALLAHASPRECPAQSIQSGARTSGETTRIGVDEIELARVPLSNARGVLRQRRLEIAPGGILPWHDHAARQGMGLLVEGELTEYRNDCRDPLRFVPGDIVRETEHVAHYWRNESAATAVLLVTDVLPE